MKFVRKWIGRKFVDFFFIGEHVSKAQAKRTLSFIKNREESSSDVKGVSSAP